MWDVPKDFPHIFAFLQWRGHKYLLFQNTAQMPADETSESPLGFEERLRRLESGLSAEQERSRLLENRLRQMEKILEAYGLTLPADAIPLPKNWLLNNARANKLPLLLELLTLIEQYWNGNRYEFRVRGHKRVTLFRLS